MQNVIYYKPGWIQPPSCVQVILNCLHVNIWSFVGHLFFEFLLTFLKEDSRLWLHSKVSVTQAAIVLVLSWHPKGTTIKMSSDLLIEVNYLFLCVYDRLIYLRIVKNHQLSNSGHHVGMTDKIPSYGLIVDVRTESLCTGHILFSAPLFQIKQGHIFLPGLLW